MISERELSQIARKRKASFGIVEKDCFLTMLLEGISNEKNLAKTLVFKGGTALRKAYFGEYRYSEDLDFTLLQHLAKKEIEGSLSKAFAFLKQKYGANYRITSFHQNKGFSDIKIQFDGLRGGKNSIALDLMSSETLVLPPKEKKIIDEYNGQKFSLLVYPLEEILLEKLRSLLQRTRVRDYFDCWFLLKHKSKQIDLQKVSELFEKKAAFKKVKLKATAQFFEQSKIEQAKSYFERQLKEQASDLPKFETIVKELKEKIEQLKLAKKQ